MGRQHGRRLIAWNTEYMAVVTLRENTQNNDYLYRFKISVNSFAKTSKE